MPIRGGFISIALVAIFGALMWGALGLLMGSRARTFEAASGLMNMMSVPMWVLSGVFFAASNFPDAVQPFIQLLPLTALVDALRAVVLEGASLASIWNELAIMAGWTIVPFAIALKIFRWRWNGLDFGRTNRNGFFSSVVKSNYAWWCGRDARFAFGALHSAHEARSVRGGLRLATALPVIVLALFILSGGYHAFRICTSTDRFNSRT